jgi:nucleotide-binding universal stress UspA family protein
VDIRVVKFSSELKSTLNELGPTILTNEPDWVQEYSNLSFEHVSSQEPKKAIVEYSRYNGVNLIIQTYEESQGHLYKLNSELQWTLENAPCESLVLDAEEFTSAEKISVISTKEYYVPTKLAVADSICQTHNAVLDLVQVVPETAADAQVESIENYHTELESSLKSKTTTNILKTSNGLVEEVKTYTTDSDLIIASIDISTMRKRVFGSTSSQMARDINVPLLLVYSEYQYRYHTIYKRILMKYLFRGF